MKTKNIRYEIDYKQRLNQSKQSKNQRQKSALGFSLYRVYKPSDFKGVPKIQLNLIYGRSLGKTYNILKSRAARDLQSYIINDTYFVTRYEKKWLKESQATLLRLQGHKVEPLN